MEIEQIKTASIFVALVIIFLESAYITVILHNRDVIIEKLYEYEKEYGFK